MKHSKKLTIFIILIIIISCSFYIYKKHGKGFYELYTLKKQLDIKPALLHKPICKGFFSDIIFK